MGQLQGTYHITMVLPAWTVENDLTLIPQPNGVLGGTLDTLDGNPPVSFACGRWNKEFFQIGLAVGPGQLQLTGRVRGDTLDGVVVIEDTPDQLSGTRISDKDAN
jgi:hypothetical protein